ncbi:hypothetical protein JCM3774_006497 [Rhodotorula dairenensis]
MQMLTRSQAWALLRLFCLTDIFRSLAVHSLAARGVLGSPTAVTFASETLKLVVATAGIACSRDGRLLDRFRLGGSKLTPVPNKSRFARCMPYLSFAVPAALYTFNNNLFLRALYTTSPAMLHICTLSKIPFTAILHHIAVRRRESEAMWLSLAILTCGAVIAVSPEELPDPEPPGLLRLANFARAPLVGVVIGAVSACASVWNEVLIKKEIDFWAGQFYLYLWGCLFAGGAAALGGVRGITLGSPAVPASPAASTLVVAVSAGTGLLAADILRQQDNLVKLIGASLGACSVFVLQHIFYPLVDEVNFHTTFGVGLLTIATYAYDWHKDHADVANQVAAGGDYLELDSTEQGEEAVAEQVGSNGQKEGALLAGRERPSLAWLSGVLGFVIVVSAVLTMLPVPEQSIRKDLKEYFTPLKLPPAQWDVPVRDLDCLLRFSGGGEIHHNASFIADLEERIGESGCPVFPIPDAGLITHLYWSGPWKPNTHALTIDTWLATQRWRSSHLIWWYEGEGPPLEWASRYTDRDSPYRELVEFRQFDDSLAEGTCLADMPEWYDVAYRQKVKMPIQSRSDLVRILLLAKFGGLWLDADSIPLRDLTPLLRMGPVVPTNGYTSNNNVLVYGPTYGGVGKRVMEIACQLPYDRIKAQQLYPELNLTPDHWYWLYNEGLHRLCRTRGCGVGNIAIQLVDGMYWSENTFAPCERGKYPAEAPLPAQIHGPFVWHARMTKIPDDDECYDRSSGTLLSVVRQRVDEILLHNQLGHGRNIFPGPGYAPA